MSKILAANPMNPRLNYQWFGCVSNKKHYLNAQVHFPLYFPTSDGFWTHPKLWDGPRKAIYTLGNGIKIQVQGGVLVFFFGGGKISTEKTQHISGKPVVFFCVCVCLFLWVFVLFMMFFLTIGFQRLFLILCIFSLNYYTKWLVVPVRKTLIMGHSCPCNRGFFHAVYTFRCRLELLSIST